jgi:sugar lactone lactonase YvrE
MKKTFVVLLGFCMLYFISCSNRHIPTEANIAGTASYISGACTPGTINYTVFSYMYNPLTATAGGIIVINSQSDYLAHYAGYALPGSPTPTPVPVDFNTKTIIGLPETISCGTSIGLTNITTDCKGVTLNMRSSGSCSGVICNSVFSMTYFWLVDKTTLPVYVFDTWLACPTLTPTITVAVATQTAVAQATQTMQAIATMTATVAVPRFITQWGSYGDCLYGGCTNEQFYMPSGIASAPDGSIYVVDGANYRIIKFSSTGAFSAVWGNDGTSGNGSFNYPLAVAVDFNGNVYVADSGNNRIQKFTSDGSFLLAWGASGGGNSQFSEPSGIAADSSGNIYVSDRGNNRVQKFDSGGNYLAQWGSSGSGDGQFNVPFAIAVDSSNNVYVCDVDNYRIEKFSQSGTFLSKFGGKGAGFGGFGMMQQGIAVDSSGNVYVTDPGNLVIQKFDLNGNYVTQWNINVAGDTSQIDPWGIAVDASYNVYVVDTANSKVVKYGY